MDGSKVEIATNNTGEDTGVGASSPNAKLEVLGNSGSNILRLDYSTSDYANFNINSSGGLTLTTTNSSPSTITNGILSTASSTIGGGSAATGLTVNGTATSSNVVDSALTNGDCVEASTNGLLTTTGSACSSTSGTVTSVGLSTPNSTLTLGGTNPVTTSGTITADLNLANPNNWTGLQTFANSSSTLGTISTLWSTTASTTNEYVSSLGTPAGTFVAANAQGELIATTSPTGTNYWTLSGNNIYNNNSESVGISTT
jgi:hypothetical protein